MGQQQPQSKYRPGVEPVPGYHLRRWLGKGGFGEVWEASGPGGPKAALKFINLSGKEGRKEFRAVCMVKNVRHANLVPITAMWLLDSEGNILPDSWGEATSPPSNQTGNLELVIAMGLGEKNLLDRLKECMKGGHSGIPFDELLGYMAGSARAIDFLNSPTHDQGGKPVAIHHCDIKPQNIMIVGGAVQVCDFGLAQITTADNSNLMKSMIGGGFSPAYAAPESLMGKGPNRQTDLYSLAISYVELRTGALPFLPRSDFGMVRKAHIEGKLDLSRLEKNPEEVKVVRKATSPRPEDRYQTATEFVQALRAAGKAGAAPPVSPPTQPAGPAAPPEVRLHSGMMVGQAYQLQQESWNLGWLSCWTAANSKKQEEQLLIRDLHVGPPETTDWDAVEACESALADSEEKIFSAHQKTWGLFPSGQPILYDVYDGARRGRLRWLIFAFRREQNSQKPLVDRLRGMSDSERTQIRTVDLVNSLRPIAKRIDLLNHQNYELGGRNGQRLRRGKIQLLNLSPWTLWAGATGPCILNLHLGDFCSARFMEVDHGALPAEEFLPRNPCLPPEALRKRLTPSADVYALAKTYVLLRQAIAPGGLNAPLFAGPGADWEEVRRRIEERTTPPGGSNESKVLARALTDLVKDRYATADEFLTALEGAIQKDSLHEETVNKHPSSHGSSSAGGRAPLSSWNPSAAAIDVDLTRSLMPPDEPLTPSPAPQFSLPAGGLAWQNAPLPPASPVPPEAPAGANRPNPQAAPQYPPAAPRQPYPAATVPLPADPPAAPPAYSVPQPTQLQPTQLQVGQPAAPALSYPAPAPAQPRGVVEPAPVPAAAPVAEAPTQRSSSIPSSDRSAARGIFQTQPPKPRNEAAGPSRPLEPGWIGGLEHGAVVFEDCMLQKRLAYGLQTESRFDVFEASDGTGRSRVVLAIRQLPDDLVGSLDLAAIRQLKDRTGLHPNLSNIRVYWFLSQDLQPIPGASSLEILESGRPRYFAMGGRAADRTLAERCEAMWRSGHGLMWKELLILLKPIAGALDALAQPIFESNGRQASIQHLDVQPANILLDGPESPRLNGLNFARLIPGTSVALPQTWGEPHFFTPPEVRRHVATIRSDQYALAALCLTLRLGLNWQKPDVAASSPADWLEKLPAAERAALEPALRETPSQRWPSCEALMEAFAAALSQPGAEDCLPAPPLKASRITPAAPPAPPLQAAPAFVPPAQIETPAPAAAQPAPYPQPGIVPTLASAGGSPVAGAASYGAPSTGAAYGAPLQATAAAVLPAGLGGLAVNSPIVDSMRLTPAGGSGLRPSPTVSSWHSPTPTGTSSYMPPQPGMPPQGVPQPGMQPPGPGYPGAPGYPPNPGYPGAPGYPGPQGYPQQGALSYPGGPAYPGGQNYPSQQGYGYGNPYVSGYAPAPPPLDPTTSWVPSGYPPRPGFAPPGASGAYPAPGYSGGYPASNMPQGYPQQGGPPSGMQPSYPAHGPTPGYPQQGPQSGMQPAYPPPGGPQGYGPGGPPLTESQLPWHGYGFNQPSGSNPPGGPQSLGAAPGPMGYGLQSPPGAGPIVSPPPALGFSPPPPLQATAPPAASVQQPAVQTPAPQTPSQPPAAVQPPPAPAPQPAPPRPVAAPPAAALPPVAPTPVPAPPPARAPQATIESPRAPHAPDPMHGSGPPHHAPAAGGSVQAGSIGVALAGPVALPQPAAPTGSNPPAAPAAGFGYGPPAGTPAYTPFGGPGRVAPFPAPPTPSPGLRVTGDWQGLMSGGLPTPAGATPSLDAFGIPKPAGGPLSTSGEFDWDQREPQQPPAKPSQKHMRETPRGEAQKDTSLNDPRPDGG